MIVVRKNEMNVVTKDKMIVVRKNEMNVVTKDKMIVPLPNNIMVSFIRKEKSGGRKWRYFWECLP